MPAEMLRVWDTPEKGLWGFAARVWRGAVPARASGAGTRGVFVAQVVEAARAEGETVRGTEEEVVVEEVWMWSF